MDFSDWLLFQQAVQKVVKSAIRTKITEQTARVPAPLTNVGYPIVNGLVYVRYVVYGRYITKRLGNRLTVLSILYALVTVFSVHAHSADSGLFFQNTTFPSFFVAFH